MEHLPEGQRIGMAKKPDLSLIANELCGNGLDSEWLEESYRDPIPFWQALKDSHDSFFPLPGKSIPFDKYDFYHDIVARNRENNAPALRRYNPVSGWNEISYSELGEMAGRKAAAWTSRGVRPGQRICIVYPLCVDCVVSLLAALKIGLIFSLLPPQGRTFLENRLEMLDPEYLVTDDMYYSLVSSWQERIIPEDKSAKGDTSVSRYSYSYPSGAVVALYFDPCSQSPHIPKELISDAAYLPALRDGLIALDLRPGSAFAAPGFHFLETQPALLLTSLLNGTTFLHLNPDEVEKNPELLIAAPLRAVGITRKVREILLKTPVDVGKSWHSWFKNPAECQDIDRWQRFIKTLKLDEVFCRNLKVSSGGCPLFSAKRKGTAHLNIIPSAGVPWSLSDLSGGDSEAVGTCGFFSPAGIGQEADKKDPGTSIIAKSRKEWMYAGARFSGRAGRTYPLAEVIDVVQHIPMPYSLYFSIAKAPPSGDNLDYGFVLLVFTGSEKDINKAEISGQIRNRIEMELGREFLPDRIDFFSLYPRYDPKGAVDHSWCGEEYLTGGLYRKSRGEIYRCLARLREYGQPHKERFPIY